VSRIAIVTPYHKETRALLERCLNSVRAQTVAADHLMIADGHPQDWIDEGYWIDEGVQVKPRHIRLDHEHGDAGNAARGIGALLAIAEGYDAIGQLDADNWIEPDHVASCLAAAATRDPCDYVVAKRILRRPDESVMPLAETWPYDTNCLFFLRGGFAVLPHWAMIPKPMALSGDRVFYTMLQRRGFAVAYTDHPTVNYHNLWASSYRALGELAPKGAKPNANVGLGWMTTLSARDQTVASRLIGFG